MKHSSCTKLSNPVKIADLSGVSKAAAYKFIKQNVTNLLREGNFTSARELYICMAINIEQSLCKNFKSLLDLRKVFRTNEDCIKFLEELNWGNIPVSPYDKSSKVWKSKDGWYKCKNTGKEFNVLTGTLFQSTKIALPIWFEIIFREHSDKGGLAATTVARDYGITRRTAWNMLQKIRNAMGKENHQELSGTVEVDEYYSGGLHKNMHYDKKLKAKSSVNQGKKLIQGFVQRGGNVVMRVIPDRTDSTLVAGILRYVKPGSTIYSDDNPSYQKLPPIYEHSHVVHSKGNYVSKDNKDVHTNTVECMWSGHKMTENTHLKISLKHLQNYVNETAFRYNTRKMESSDACIWFLQNIEDTKITWKEIRNAEYRRYNRDKERAA